MNTHTLSMVTMFLLLAPRPGASMRNGASLVPCMHAAA